MLVTATRFTLTLVLELLLIRAAVRLLPMRSAGAYALTDLTYFCIAMSKKLATGGSIGFPWIYLHFSFPALFAEGPLIRRVIATIAVNLASVLSEIAGVVLWTLLSGGSMVEEPSFDRSNYLSMVAVYCTIIVIGALAYEAIVAGARRYGNSSGASAGPHATNEMIELPIIVEMVVSTVLYIVIHTRVYALSEMEPSTYALVVLYFLFSSSICLILFRAVQRDSLARQQLAEEAAALRQTRHSVAEVIDITRRATGVRKLRHDLANQTLIVRSLASSGNVGEADRYLKALQEQAHEIYGGEA